MTGCATPGTHDLERGGGFHGSIVETLGANTLLVCCLVRAFPR